MPDLRHPSSDDFEGPDREVPLVAPHESDAGLHAGSGVGFGLSGSLSSGLSGGGDSATEDVALRHLLDRLDLEGDLGAAEELPAGLVDRVYHSSVLELRRSVSNTLVTTGSSLRLSESDSAAHPYSSSSERGVGRLSDHKSAWRRLFTDSTGGRVSVVRRFGPALAMAACVGLAFVVAIPSMTPLLRSSDGGSESEPYALRDTSSAVEPVLAALLQRGAGESEWSGVEVIRFSPDQFRPISPDGLGAAAPMVPIVETREASFSDFEDEFSRIRDAAKRSS